jgi:hypothetical protein
MVIRDDGIGAFLFSGCQAVSDVPSRVMDKKIGTGELRPFKKDSAGSETISNSTDNAHRKGFTENFTYTKATRNVTELEPFKMGPSGPGKNTNPDHPPFKEGGPKIRTFPAFSDRPVKGD